MTKLEKQALLNWARQLSDQELKDAYNKAIIDLSDKLEDHYFFEYPFPKKLQEKVRILGNSCKERGINLWT